jgi:hypothetical protein
MFSYLKTDPTKVEDSVTDHVSSFFLVLIYESLCLGSFTSTRQVLLHTLHMELNQSHHGRTKCA